VRRPERFLALSIPLLLAVALPCALAREASPQARLDAVEKAIDSARQRQDEAAKLAEGLAAELAQLQAQSIAAAEAQQAHEAELTRIDEQLAALAADEQATTEALARDRAHQSELLMTLTRMAAAPRESLLLAPGEPVDALRGALVLGRIIPTLAAEADALKAEIAQLATVRDEMQAARKHQTEEKTALATEAAHVAQLMQRKAALQQSAVQTADAAGKRAVVLAGQATNLRELIERLEVERQKAEAERRQKAEAERAKAEAEQKARQEAEPPKDMVAVTAPPPLKPEGERHIRPFSEARGAMVFPVSGTLVRRWGTPDEYGQPSRGIALEARPGALVVAPFDGQVLFAGPFRGYGQILIIAHGDGYHSLLAGLDRLDSSVGQWLVAGEPVGTMADGADNPRLYLELRHNDQPINPAPWLTTRAEKVNG
jgi:septal ring factor EnvC (AmiA/AmiB activator)